MVYTLGTEYLHTRGMRSPLFYIIAAVVSLLFLPAFGKALRMKWGMTAVTAGYFLLLLSSNLLLQLFPAEPKLGPILTHTTHFQPANFPALVFIPAMAMDLIMQHSKTGAWTKSLLLSLAFVGLLAAIQYPLSGFLLESPHARNWFFTANSYYFQLSPNMPFRYKFRPAEIAPLSVMLTGLGLAVLLGCVAARIGLRWGRWMQTIQR
jgi:hypothetical protein